MIVEITRDNIAQIKNLHLANYAAIYAKIQQDFFARIRALGVEFDPRDDRAEAQTKIANVVSKGAVLRNDDKSIYVNHISPACAACQTGLGTATFFISLKCHRNCFFCFNPNQENYAEFQTQKRNCVRELEEIYQSGARLEHLALTGGEPLLHRAEVVEFFNYANEKFPHAYKRLYTSGDHIDVELLTALQRARLDEIRFSIRLYDSEQARRHTYDRIALTKAYIPNVMVEMPVLPGTLPEMKQVLTRLDELDVSGINLLEFCFPLNNADMYRDKGYRIKQRPFRVLYNYSYAGGLPVAQSESACLDLVEFALDQKLKLGVHYCSLENKHTGQVYQQHFEQKIPAHLYFSPRDYFLKSAKVFGKDLHQVLPIFERMRYRDFQRNRDRYYLEFHVEKIAALKDLAIEIGIATSVMEARPDGAVIRELKVDLTTPQTFDLATDV
ncbi:MAG: radical SAM protein [Chloroflexi bacterium]|nr:radical SAM protein [Chloroflexota bacterium]